MYVFLVLLLCGLTTGSSLQSFNDMNTEDLELKMKAMEERLVSLEKRESQDILQKVREEILVEVKTTVTRFLEEKYNLTEKLTRIESAFINNQNDMQGLNNTLQNHSSEIQNINTQLLRIETVCSPPCENGGKCEKNVCVCPPLFLGDRCQTPACSPPCLNGGQCTKNNVCNCTSSHSGDRCQNDEPQCGVDHVSVGHNGSRYATGHNRRYLVSPWMAAVYEDDNYFCDGSVVHRSFVLTSARCMLHGYERRGVNSVIMVKLGLTDLNNRKNHLQEHIVRWIHMHPDYELGSYDNNIALLELERPIEYNLHIRPVCLPPKEIPDDNPFYKPQSSARGIELYHYIYSASSSSLKNVELIIQRADVCKGIYRGAGYWSGKYPSTDNSFCLVVKDVTSACDAFMWGTPLMQSRTTEDGTHIWTQVGITSTACKGKEKDVIAYHVQNLMPWVEATIEAASEK